MRRQAITICLFVLLVASCSFSSVNVPRQFIEKINLNAIVNVRSVNYSGSGFLIGDDGRDTYLLTTQHLVDMSKQKNFSINDGLYFYEAEYVSSVPWKDLALLKIKNKKGLPKIVLPAEYVIPPIGETLYRIARNYNGYLNSDEGTMGPAATFSGFVAYGFNDGTAPGTSGSIVISKESNMIGHIIRKNYFVPLSWNELLMFFPNLDNIKP